jgi:hypothetical protein
MRGWRIDLFRSNATREISREEALQEAGSAMAEQQIHGLQQNSLCLSIPLPRIMLYACLYVNSPITSRQSVTCNIDRAVPLRGGEEGPAAVIDSFKVPDPGSPTVEQNINVNYWEAS